MAGKLTLDVAVPERRMLSEEVDEVQGPGADGSLGILPDHAPLMTQLGIGVLSYKAAAQTRYMALTGGVVEVPVLIGFNPDTIESWDLAPWDLLNSFETIIPAKR